jgi:hypothetical protein
MGQCGCGEYQPERQYSVRGCVFGIVLYPGCDYCAETLAIDPYFFTKDSEFIVDRPTENVKPDEYGGPLGLGFEIFSVADLREAAKECDPVIDPNKQDAYSNMEDWLDDYGLQLLQGALRKCRERVKRENAERERRNNERVEAERRGRDEAHITQGD